MDIALNLSLTVNRARFAESNSLFKDCNISEERTVTQYELVLFLDDGGYSVINGEKYAITKGSIRLHKPDDIVYSCKFSDIYTVHFDLFDNDLLDNISSFTYNLDYNSSVEIFKKIIEAYADESTLKVIYNLFKILNLLQINTKNTLCTDKNILSVRNYIDNNYKKKITLSELSKQYYIHPVYLQKKFKSVFGITPNEYIKKLRINEAKKLLLTTNMSIESVSESIGFCNTSYFIKTFCNVVNMTPAKFRISSIEKYDFI